MPKYTGPYWIAHTEEGDVIHVNRGEDNNISTAHTCKVFSTEPELDDYMKSNNLTEMDDDRI